MADGHHWSFQHVEGLYPTHRVPCDPATTQPLASAPEAIDALPVPGSSRGDVTLAEVLDSTATDGWLVLHEGTVVAEQYRNDLTPSTGHLLMSVTKSVVGAVAGILIDRGQLAPTDLITGHVPELEASGYRGATVRHLLDMRSGVTFREDYADPTAHIRMIEAAIGWQPGIEGVPPGLHHYLCSLQAGRAHGGTFDYRSSETDVLGWVCERAAGLRLPQLISDLLWRPMGAEHDAQLLCDTFGDSVGDGGLAATVRDVARFGQLLLSAGVSGGRQVIPRGWLAEVWTVDPDVRAAFAASAAEASMPGGWYRNQMWVVPGPHGDLLLAVGIFGQLVRVDPATRTVMVKLSSWPQAQDPARFFDTLLACDLVAAALSGRAGQRGRFGVAPARSIVTGHPAPAVRGHLT